MNLNELEALRLSVCAELEERLKATGGEVTEEIDWLAQRIDLLDMQTADKLDRYAYIIKTFEADEKRFKERADAFRARAQVAERAAARLKNRVLDFIENNIEPDEKGRKRVEGELFKLWVQNAGGSLPLEIDEAIDPEEVPEKFQKVSYDFDRDFIRHVLTQGNTLSFAKLGERGRILRIK